MRIYTPLIFLLLIGCASLQGHTSPVTAQRPTFSSDTATTHADTFEFESGGTIDPGSAVDTPVTLKWGAGPRTELFAGWSPFQRISGPGTNAEGVGDLQIGLRHRFLVETESAPSAALQWITNLPTGDRSQGLSSGEIDFLAAGILTKTIGELTATAFYQAGILGDPQAGDTDLEHTIALAGAAPLGQGWGVFGEVAAILNHERNQEAYVATVGGSFAVSPSFVLDAGIAVGVSDDAPDLQILFGFTSNLGTRPLATLTSGH